MKSSMSNNNKMHFSCTWKEMCSQEIGFFFFCFQSLALGDFILLISNPNDDCKLLYQRCQVNGLLRPFEPPGLKVKGEP
jgi:hypothetical protein